ENVRQIAELVQLKGLEFFRELRNGAAKTLVRVDKLDPGLQGLPALGHICAKRRKVGFDMSNEIRAIVRFKLNGTDKPHFCPVVSPININKDWSISERPIPMNEIV